MPSKVLFEKVPSEGLAHLSYIVGHRGQAAVIDPRRDCEVYVEIARRREMRITHIFETHKNEDYVIGSRDLQRRTGATIHHGTGLNWGYGQLTEEGDTFELGELRLRVLATPGHTDDSISLVLVDTGSSDDPVGVFTGDALFIGDVGRTDFYPDRPREVAGLLYDSLFDKLLPLGDHVLIWPAHGAGSVCGSGMASREFSAMGYERQHNASLQVADREEFIDNKVNEHHDQPPYFRKMEELNQHGTAPELAALPNPQPMSPQGFVEAMDGGAQVVDIRDPEAYAGAFLPGSVNIPSQMIAAYAGWLLDYDHDILLVAADPSQIEPAVRTFVRLGYDRVIGYLKGGLHGWEVAGKRFRSLDVVFAKELHDSLDQPRPPMILDVRKKEEFEAGHIEGAQHIFLGDLPEKIDTLPTDRPIVTFCGSGVRASIAASLLAKAGRQEVANNLGSLAACKALGCELVAG